MKPSQDPKKHHYVPQFYLRNFCCSDDENKVPTISRHNPFLIKKRSSIQNIGYEDYLYKITDNEIEVCIEKNLNKFIETPISQSNTWGKIGEGKAEYLSEDDKFIIYLFIMHLESRNLETLEFIKSEQNRVRDPKFRHDYSEAELMMHQEISSIPNGAYHFYLGMSGNLDQYFEKYTKASIAIFGSNIPIRTSTNPVINVPMHAFQNRSFDPRETAKWLPLSPRVGAMLVLNDKFCDFAGYQIVENDFIRTLNRLYLIQLLNTKTTRHMIANDEYIIDDFKWAGIKTDPKNSKKFRCPHIRTV